MSTPLSTRIYTAGSEVVWMAQLNLLWIVCTLAGGVVFGLGPATIAAYTLARRHVQGESIHATVEFWRVYRREFVRSSLVILPVALVATVLFGNYLSFSALGPGAGGPRIVTFVALLALACVGTYVGPLYAHYDLQLRAYLPKASLLAITRPAASLLLVFVLLTVVFVTAAVPILAPLISVGAWIHLNTWLCLRFFEENEARLHAKGNS